MTSLATPLEWEDYEGVSIAGVSKNAEIECVQYYGQWHVQLVIDRHHVFNMGVRNDLETAKTRAQYVADVMRLMK